MTDPNSRNAGVTKFVEENHPALLTYMLGFTGGDRELAEDAVQEAFTAVLSHWNTLKRPEERRPFCWACAKNHALSCWRKDKRRRTSVGIPPEFDGTDDERPGQNPTVEVESRDLAAWVARNLTPVEWEVMRRRAEGMRIREIAEALSTYPQRVLRTIWSASARIRRLGDDTGGLPR